MALNFDNSAKKTFSVRSELPPPYHTLVYPAETSAPSFGLWALYLPRGLQAGTKLFEKFGRCYESTWKQPNSLRRHQISTGSKALLTAETFRTPASSVQRALLSGETCGPQRRADKAFFKGRYGKEREGGHNQKPYVFDRIRGPRCLLLRGQERAPQTYPYPRELAEPEIVHFGGSWVASKGPSEIYPRTSRASLVSRSRWLVNA